MDALPVLHSSTDAPVNTFDFVRPLVEASGQRMPTRRISIASSLRAAAFSEAGYRIHSAFVKGSAPEPSFLLTNELEKVMLSFIPLVVPWH